MNGEKKIYLRRIVVIGVSRVPIFNEGYYRASFRGDKEKV